MNIAETILSKGADHAPALVCNNSVWNYATLRERVRAVAASLNAEGHTKGERIGIWAENGMFFVSAYFGVMRAGLVAVPLQTELSLESFTEIVRDAGLERLFVSNQYLRRLQPWAETLGLRVTTEGGVGEMAESRVILPDIDPARDLAALMFTSGTTGRPKGVMVSHRNLECNTADIVSYTGLTATDRGMVVLPFYYCFGASLLHSLLWAGATAVLSNDFRLYPETVLREMQRRDCTGLAGVPSTYQILLRRSRFRQMRFPNLRWFQQAGGKLPNPFIAELRQAFPAVKYFLMYGQTEATARLSYLPPERLADKLGSIGIGLPSTLLRVLKPDGTPVVPGSEEVGEIVATGDNITLGYWNDPQESARFFRNGSLYTGDIARVDSEGFIYIVDREREMIKSSGHRVSAKEVEDIISELADVVEVGVVGAAHELLGEAITAFVVRRPGSVLREADVLAHCQARLPGFKRPERVRFLRTMPHNSAGKLLKHKLKLAARSGSGPAGASALVEPGDLAAV